MASVVMDRIEKTILLRASRARVWRALTNAQEFGEWFGMKLDGQFAPGAQTAYSVPAGATNRSRLKPRLPHGYHPRYANRATEQPVAGDVDAPRWGARA